MVTDRRARALFINTAFEQQTGYLRQEVLGEEAWGFRGEIDDDGLQRSILEHVVRGESWSGLAHGRRSSGEDYTLQLTISPVRDRDGKVVNYLLVGRDVTRERALEAQVLHSQRIESLGTLAGGIAHDFNNILAGIFAIVSLALDQVEAGTELHDDLSDVMQAARRGKQLVAQILAFSRRIEPEMQQVDPTAVAQEALQLLRASIPTTVELAAEFEAVGPIRADPAQLHQVLVNLGTNAYHALPAKGGRITLGLERAVFDAAQARDRGLEAGPHVRLRIEDEGSGISEDLRERIFEPFFTTKPQGKGSGMGLAVVHGIVKAHQGAITLSSELGVGSTFEVLLPVGQAVRRSQEVVSEAGGGERLLLVDDEPLVLKSLRRSLKRYGYQVQAFDSPNDALEALRDAPEAVDALVTDLAMPERSGVDLVRAARELRPELPALLCTGNVELLLATERRELALPVLEKPCTPEELASAVRRVLDEAAATPRRGKAATPSRG
jgi:PAS domain S-box-containing protein